MEQELELFEFNATETAQKADGAGKDVLMTTQELSEALGCNTIAIQRTVKKSIIFENCLVQLKLPTWM